ncbi:MAG: rhomboid family intramembrane serine protease [Oscillospiraceae bacterium]|nr:rhomboid family intramembrane serine protease [Oscillospiraceae bacterium]
MNRFDKFCHKYNHWGISNLMLFIGLGNIVMWVASRFVPSANIVGLFAFHPALVMSGQIWRLFTFIFIPLSDYVFLLLLACYFYFWVGRTLENEWGKLKFNIYYLTGMLATIIYCWIAGAYGVATYLNFSLFFAYATLFPEQRILLFFILPVKVKYIAFAMAGLFVLEIIISLNLLPLIAILNYFIYFRKDVKRLFKRGASYTKGRADFKSAVNQARNRPGYEGHLHKCAKCGITDTKSPNTEFRYCSLCAHYECYCSEHIFTHEHVKNQ